MWVAAKLISAEGRREVEGVVGAVADPLEVLDAVEGQLNWRKGIGENLLHLDGR